MIPHAEPPLTDTLRAYEIPEGVRLEFRLAGPVVRACAWAIDAAIRGLLYVLLALGLSLLGGIGVGIMLIGFFLIEWFYPVVFELHKGATPGKQAMGIWVIQDNGTPVSPAASVIRNLLRAVDFLPLFYALGLLSMLLDREFRRLGDLAAGTLVVYRDQPGERKMTAEARVSKPAVELSREEQMVLLAFAERGGGLSSARRIELAELLRDLTGLTGQAAVDRLYAYANWIVRGHAQAASYRAASPPGQAGP
ncbi:MAG: RDD family protein [Gammaproteobacteria bacterium]|nr:RDD family protein [Gammaproteobacteria bacterium]